MTLGERIIRPDFAKDDEVKELKRQFVILMDKMDNVAQKNFLMGELLGSPEHNKKAEAYRCSSKAIEHMEVAAMFAVKALTA